MSISGGSKPWPTSLEDRPAGRVLVALLDGSADAAVAVAADCADQRREDLVVLNPVVIPVQTPLDATYDYPENHAEVAQYLQGLSVTIDVDGVVRSGRSVERVVTSAVEDRDVTTLVVPVASESGGGLLRRGAVEKLATKADCEVVLVDGEWPDDVARVLLPVTGGPHSGTAVDVARRVAAANDAAVDTVHVHPPDADDDRRAAARGYVETSTDRLGDVAGQTEVAEADDPATEIVERAADYDLTVIGAPTKSRLRRLVFGSVPESVAGRTDGAVLTVRSRDTRKRSLGQWP